MDLSTVDTLNINTFDVAEVTHATRAQSVPPSQRLQWRKAGYCVRCGSPTHWVQSCPILPPAPAAAMPTKTLTLWEPDDYHAYETEDDDDDSAGNCDLVHELTL